MKVIVGFFVVCVGFVFEVELHLTGAAIFYCCGQVLYCGHHLIARIVLITFEKIEEGAIEVSLYPPKLRLKCFLP